MKTLKHVFLLLLAAGFLLFSFALFPAKAKAGYTQEVQQTFTETVLCSQLIIFNPNIKIEGEAPGTINLALQDFVTAASNPGAYVVVDPWDPASGDLFFFSYSQRWIQYPVSTIQGDPCYNPEGNVIIVNYLYPGWVPNTLSILQFGFWTGTKTTTITTSVYIPTPPTIDLTVNSQQNTLELKIRNTATLAWQVARGVNTNDQIRVDSWPRDSAPGATEYSGFRSPAFNNLGLYAFTLTAINEDGQSQDTVSVNVTGSPDVPEISLSPASFTFTGVSGGAAPPAQTLTIRNTGKSTLNYRGQTNQSWCRLNGQNNAGQVTGSLDKNKAKDLAVSVDAPSNVGSFNCTLTVSDPAATNSPQTAAVAYTVTGTPNPPTNLQVNNTAQCGEIRLTWQDNSGNEDGFYLYRATRVNPSFPGDYTRIATRPANTVSYTDNPAVNQTYTYAVTAYNIGGESAPATSGSVYNYSCSPNLASSTKTIREVNGTAYTSQTIRNGDTLKFQITIRNSGNATANTISVSDTLSANLSYQGNARLKKGSVASQSITGSQAGQTITFSSLGNKAPDSQDGITWLLTFDARITTSSSQAVEFAQNTASISYQGGSATTSTGLFQVRTGQARVPIIREISP